jgi:uncharacterized surface protein with fasciclin (FAS1) repeats
MDKSRTTSTTSPAKDIVDTAIAAGQFTSLAAAITAAGLTEKLKGLGPFTVFGPSDDAFKKLPAGTLDALLKDKVKLAKVLGHHVVARKIMAKDVKAGELKTINGGTLAAAVSSGVVTVDGAHVTRVDIEATNGVIHVIDRVLTPKDVKLAAAA